jgi:hypothetical protein
MRASLARHIAEIQKPADANTPQWQTADAQKRSGESEIENLDWAEEYAEPGYQAELRGVLLADWNYFTRDVTDVLQRAGFACEWNDEWSKCEDCGKLVRTSGDSYGWQPYYVLQNDCEIVCLDCVDWADYLESCEDNAHKAVMRACDPSKYGYQLLSEPGEYENGLHQEQDDNPVTILRALQEKGEKGIVFRVPETSQFYITFEVWARGVTIERVMERLGERVRELRERYYQDTEAFPNEYRDAKQALAIVEERIETELSGGQK